MFFSLVFRNPTSENQIVPQKCRQYSFFSGAVWIHNHGLVISEAVQWISGPPSPAKAPGGGPWGRRGISLIDNTRHKRWSVQPLREEGAPEVSAEVGGAWILSNFSGHHEGCANLTPNILQLPHLNIFSPSKPC